MLDHTAIIWGVIICFKLDDHEYLAVGPAPDQPSNREKTVNACLL